MEYDSVFYEFSALAVEICLFGIAYKIYKTNADSLKSLKKAQCFEIDNNLKKNVEQSNGIIEYGVICGNVRALTVPLRSQYVPYLQGVIREKITKEHKVKWSPFLRMWSSANNELQHSTSYIPFALCSKTSSLFKKQISVEISDPLSANELVLPTVYDEFLPHTESIGDAVFGFFRGERTIGLQEVENMLCENETLTAVGKLVIDNNKLKIKPPDNELPYFLTPLTLESLISKFSVNKNFYKIISFLLGAMSLITIIYISRRPITAIKQRINRNKERKKLELERKLRRKTDKSRKTHDISTPKCVICLDNPVELLLLECGHACLCYDCSEHVRNICPVCRNPIERTVAAFWP